MDRHPYQDILDGTLGVAADVVDLIAKKRAELLKAIDPADADSICLNAAIYALSEIFLACKMDIQGTKYTMDDIQMFLNEITKFIFEKYPMDGLRHVRLGS